MILSKLKWNLFYLLTMAICIGGETYNDILKTLQHPDKLFFDISSLITKEDGETVDDYVSSQNIMYKLDCKNNANDKFLAKYGLCGEPDIPKDFVIMKWKPLQAESQSNSTSKNASILFNMDLDRNFVPYLRSYSFEDKLPILKTKWSKLTLGISYNNESFIPSSILKVSDLTVFTMHVHQKQFILTFSGFRQKLLEFLKERRAWQLRKNPTCRVYIKLVLFLNCKNQSNLLYKRYFYFLLKLSVFWVNAGEREGIVLEGFSNGNRNWMEGYELRDTVTNLINAGQIVDNGLWSYCWMRQIMEMIHSQFDKILIKDDFFLAKLPKKKCILTNVSSDCAGNEIQMKDCKFPFVSGKPKFPQLQFLQTLYVKDFLSADEFVKDLTEKLKGLPWTLSYFQLAWTEEETFAKLSQEVYVNFTTAIQTFPPNVRIGCALDVLFMEEITDLNYIEEAVSKCFYISKGFTQIIQPLRIDLLQNFNSFQEDVFKIKEVHEKLVESFPNATISILLAHKLTKNISEATLGLYCRPDELASNEKTEILVNFARANGIPIAFKQSTSNEFKVGWWKRLLNNLGLYNLHPVISEQRKVFPLFGARNYPEPLAISGFPTDPCITWTTSVSKDGILFSLEHSGIILYIPNGISYDGLKMQLTFVLHKFYLIEIHSSGSPSGLIELLKVISEIEIAQENKMKRVIYVKCDWTSFKQCFILDGGKVYQNLLGKFDPLIKIAGFHFVNWKENSNFEWALLNFVNKTEIKLGLDLGDCLDHLSNWYRELPTLPFYSKISYLLCAMKESQPATNHDRGEMQNYLDTHLFILKHYQKLFPKDPKEMFFRLSFTPSRFGVIGDNVENGTVGNFLKFFSDVNEYAEAYKIKFFMFPAFDSLNKFGWWKITDFKDLENSSVYIEKESEYLGKATWRPPKIEAYPLKLSNAMTFALVFCVLIIILISTLLGLILNWFRRRTQLLTKDEVQEFLHGSDQPEFITGTEFDSIKFPKEFDIPKKDILLLSFLDKGHFGMVYKALLKNFKDGFQGDSKDSSVERHVAVKMPLPNCTKESFKTMLSELKVHCYVGKHSHVLHFIGAHIKNIRKGEVYIVTELCEEGTLKNYLCKLQDEKESVKVYELYRFSYEIALGMDYISEKKIVHGDLSARNILLDSAFTCKIGDFGLARKLYEAEEYIKKGNEDLPWRWMALESLKNNQFTTKSDVWSYGVTLWEIFSLGTFPFPGITFTVDFVQDLENGLRMSQPSHCTNPIYSKMRDCWENDPGKRPTFEELANFFANLRKGEYVKISRKTKIS